MPTSKEILNEFYQGLKLLIEFETGQSHGAMSSEFYAINKVVSHFNTALDNGDVVAPFFLHYLADKFPGYIDKSQLPDLASVPSHKSKAPAWIKDYKTFLTLYKKIDEHTRTRVIGCANAQQQIELNKKNIQRQLQRVGKEARNLMQSTSPIAGVLAAKLLQYLQKMTNNSLCKLISEAMEESAFFPNVFAMYEYAQFLQNEQLSANPLAQEKLQTELSLLENSNGDIKVLVEYYQNQIETNSRFLSQWLFQSALHGELGEAKWMVERYIFDEDMQWYDKISDQDKLEEAIKWFNWYESHAPLTNIHTYWREIVKLASNYRVVIGDNKYRAYFLCYALDRLNQAVLKQPQTVSEDFFLIQNIGLIEVIQNFREIMSLTWSLNNSKLPVGLSSMTINEMATILEARHEYKEAERLYRQVYVLDRNHPILQYNLANILFLQNKNKTEQISLYFAAAEQGCSDSVQHLFKVLVVNKEGTIENLEKLRQIVESFKSDLDLEISAELFINLITVTIFQKLMNIEVIKWEQTESSGKKFAQALFIFEEESQDKEAFVLDSPDNSSENLNEVSSIEISRTDVTTSHSELTEKSKEASSSSNSFRLFQPHKKETKSLDMKRERAIRKLHELNSKTIKTLRLNDFIQAKKAYQILMGKSEGIEVSHKGRTSGSRAKVGSKNLHLTHGRDRMSIGAQSDIKEAISGFCSQMGI